MDDSCCLHCYYFVMACDIVKNMLQNKPKVYYNAFFNDVTIINFLFSKRVCNYRCINVLDLL